MDRYAWDERYDAAELVWSAGPNQFLVAEMAEMAGVRPGRALDLACGEGRNAIWLAERGWSVTAVDFSTVALARAAELAAERRVTVDWVTADLGKYSPQPGRYDLVLIAYVHLPPEASTELFRGAAAAVAPGGTLVAVGHDRDNLARGYGGPRDPRVLYTPDGVAALLSGLTIRRAERVRRRTRTGDGDRDAIDTLVRAVRHRATT